jgi:hypothetical protein
MPETDVDVNFTISGLDQAKAEIRGFESEIKELQAEAGKPSASQYLMFGSASEEDRKKYWASLEKGTEATKELGEAAGNTRGIFEQFEGTLGRIVFRMAAFELIRGTIEAIGKGIQEAMNVGAFEEQFKVIYGNVEHTAESFQTLHEESMQFGQDFVKETEPAIRALETVSTGTEDLNNKYVALSELSKVYGADLKTIAQEYANIQESGTVSLNELIKLNRELGGSLKDDVDQMRDLEQAHKYYQETSRAAEADQRRNTEAADRAASAQERLGKSTGLSAQMFQAWLGKGTGLSAQMFQAFAQGGAMPTSATYQAGPSIYSPSVRMDTRAMGKALSEEFARGTKELAAETGLSEKDVRQLEAANAPGFRQADVTSAAREAQQDTRRQAAELEQIRRESETRNYEAGKREIAARVPGEITGITHGAAFQAQLASTMGKLSDNLARLNDPVGKIMVNTEEMARNSAWFQAMISGPP